MRLHRRVAALVVAAACAAATAGCATSTITTVASAPLPAATTTSYIATPRSGGLPVYAAPGAARPAITLSPRTAYGSTRVVLVLAAQRGWLHVLLPIRPLGSNGWVSASQVTLTRTDYRVDVALSQHRLTVYRGTQAVLTTAAATGTTADPTPTGLLYVTDVVRTAHPDGPYGPYALGLSGYSPTLTSFDGGDGEIGIHGTNQPQLIGQSVSHGCVRVPNNVAAELASALPLGTPVTVHA